MAKTQKITEHLPIFEELIKLNKTNPVLWLPVNVPSLKNSKEIVTVPTNSSACCKAPVFPGKPPICSHCKKPTVKDKSFRLIPSKTVAKYIKTTQLIYDNAVNRNRVKSWIAASETMPFYLGMYFVRERDNVWDFNNATQIITDLFKRYGYIEDDDVRNLIPVYLGHHKNAINPGVILVPMFNFATTLEIFITKLYDKPDKES